MGIFKAAVGDIVCEFLHDASLDEVWAFIDKHLSVSDVERAVVLVADSGRTHGEIWDSSVYFAHWETPDKMRAYLNFVGFDYSDDGS